MRTRLFLLAAALLTFSAISTVGAKAEAHAHHTASYCSATAPDICAHLGYKDEPNTTDAASFMLHFTPAAAANVTLLTDVAVELSMEMMHNGQVMRHGSSPVTITPVDEVHFQVTDAYFLMSGTWDVVVTFKYDGVEHMLSIPMPVP